MFDWINWSTVLTAIGNIILVSIPEETFFVMFCLLLLNQFDFLNSKSPKGRKFQRYDFMLISIPILSGAIISNILRFVTKVDISTSSIITLSVILLTIIITYQLYWNFLDILKAALSLFIATIVLLLIEYSYAPAILYATGKTIQEVNSSLFVNFLFSLPERFIEFGIITYLLIKKSSINQKNFLRVLITNPTLRNTTVSLLVFNLSLLFLVGKTIILDKCLVQETFNLQMMVIISIIIFPLSNLTVYFGILYYKVNRELDERHLTSISIKSHIDKIKSFTNTGDLLKIEKTISEIESYINDLEKHY